MDVSQCYDCIAHTMAVLTLQVFKVRESSVMTMFSPIQSSSLEERVSPYKDYAKSMV